MAASRAAGGGQSTYCRSPCIECRGKTLIVDVEGAECRVEGIGVHLVLHLLTGYLGPLTFVTWPRPLLILSTNVSNTHMGIMLEVWAPSGSSSQMCYLHRIFEMVMLWEKDKHKDLNRSSKKLSSVCSRVFQSVCTDVTECRQSLVGSVTTANMLWQPSTPGQPPDSRG